MLYFTYIYISDDIAIHNCQYQLSLHKTWVKTNIYCHTNNIKRKAKFLAAILVEINKNILDLLFIVFCLNRNESLLVIVFCKMKDNDFLLKFLFKIASAISLMPRLKWKILIILIIFY